jgi:hypothetical protein
MDVDLVTAPHALYRWNIHAPVRGLFAKPLSELAKEDLIQIIEGIGRDFCAEPLSGGQSQVALVEGVSQHRPYLHAWLTS